jgi:hypothetical protein
MFVRQIVTKYGTKKRGVADRVGFGGFIGFYWGK